MSVVSRDEGAFGRCSFLPKTPEENEQALSVRWGVEVTLKPMFILFFFRKKYVYCCNENANHHLYGKLENCTVWQFSEVTEDPEMPPTPQKPMFIKQMVICCFCQILYWASENQRWLKRTPDPSELSADGDGSRHRPSRCCIKSLVIKKYTEQEGRVDKVPNWAWHGGTFLEAEPELRLEISRLRRSVEKHRDLKYCF